MSKLGIFFALFFLCACSSPVRVDYNEELRRYAVVEDARLLGEKPLVLPRSYELLSLPLFGYACFEFKTNPKPEDFKKLDVCMLSADGEDKDVYESLSASVSRFISEYEKSGETLGLSDYLKKYRESLVFLYFANYPPVIRVENGKTIQFVFYGAIYSPLSNRLYLVEIYDKIDFAALEKERGGAGEK